MPAVTPAEVHTEPSRTKMGSGSTRTAGKVWASSAHTDQCVAARRPSSTPAAALAHVPRFVRETPVLNDYRFGGYLIWRGVRPFIDSRADLYGDAFLENYAAIVRPDRDALASTLAYYHVRWTIFAAAAPVAAQMDAMPGWHRLYGDGVAVVHVHD